MRGRSFLALVGAFLVLSAGSAFAAGSCAIYKTFSTGGSFTAADANSIQTTLGQINATFFCLDDYSATVAQMQTTVDPYPGGVESLATTGQGEIERLRYLLQQIHGRTYWYQDPDPLNPPGDIQVGVPNSRSSKMIFSHASSAFATTFQAGQATAAGAYVWPTAPPSSGTGLLASDTAGTTSWLSNSVANGFTGAASFTANGVLYGAGTSALGVTAQGATNTVLHGNTGGAPSYAAVDAALVNTGPGATGPIGSATVVPIITIDAKGRVTALSSATITTGTLTGTGLGSLILVRKTLDETVNNSAVFQNDDALTFTAVANSVHVIEITVWYDTSTVADIKFQMTGPSGSFTQLGIFGLDVAAVSRTEKISWQATGGAVGGLGGGNAVMAKISVLYTVGVTGGPTTLQWAQNTAEATDTKVLAGSYMLVHTTP